jgi:hypothetical protein
MVPLQPLIFPHPQPLLPFQPAMFRLPPLLPPPQPMQLLLSPPPFLQPQPLLLQPPPPQFFQQRFHPAPGPKTVYILSYSEVIKRHPGAEAQLRQQHTSFGVPALLTVCCHLWRVPPADMCRNYSGISPQIQNFILGSRTAVHEMCVFVIPYPCLLLELSLLRGDRKRGQC